MTSDFTKTLFVLTKNDKISQKWKDNLDKFGKKNDEIKCIQRAINENFQETNILVTIFNSLYCYSNMVYQFKNEHKFMDSKDFYTPCNVKNTEIYFGFETKKSVIYLTHILVYIIEHKEFMYIPIYVEHKEYLMEIKIIKEPKKEIYRDMDHYCGCKLYERKLFDGQWRYVMVTNYSSLMNDNNEIDLLNHYCSIFRNSNGGLTLRYFVALISVMNCFWFKLNKPKKIEQLKNEDYRAFQKIYNYCKDERYGESNRLIG